MRPYLPIRFRWFIPVAIWCALMLAGCVPQQKPMAQQVKPTTVKDVTADPMTALKLIKDLSSTEAERDALFEAYDRLWHTNADIANKAAQLQHEIADKELQTRAAEDRAAVALEAQNKLDRTWMFTLIFAGIGAMLGGAALAYFGRAMPMVPSGKIGGAIAVIGFLLVIMAPNARKLEGPIRMLAFVVVGTVIVGLGSWVAKGIKDQWSSNRK